MRLISSDGTPSISEGNLQIFINNEWMTLCFSPSETDMVDAACKLLGYPGLQELRIDHNNQYDNSFNQNVVYRSSFIPQEHLLLYLYSCTCVY